jgi:hypothetical protein
MKKSRLIAGILLSAIVLGLTACSSNEVSQGSGTEPDSTSAAAYFGEDMTTPPPEETTPVPPPQPTSPDYDIAGVTWFVEPVFIGRDYNPYAADYGEEPWTPRFIRHNWADDSFTDGWYSNNVVDERTLGLTGNISHGKTYGGTFPWLYDSRLRLVGFYWGDCSGSDIVMYPVREFATRFPDMVDKVLIVHRVDSTRRNLEGREYGFEGFLDEAYLGESAAFFNGSLITEFEATCHEERRLGLGRVARAAPMSRGGKFGIVGSQGETLVPFVFEDALIIDDYTAFVKVDELHWGIVTWVAIEDVPHRESLGGYPPPVEYRDGDRITDVWRVVQDGAGLIIVDDSGNRFVDVQFDTLSMAFGVVNGSAHNNGSYSMIIMDGELVLRSAQFLYFDSTMVSLNFVDGNHEIAFNNLHRIAEVSQFMFDFSSDFDATLNREVVTVNPAHVSHFREYSSNAVYGNPHSTTFTGTQNNLRGYFTYWLTDGELTLTFVWQGDSVQSINVDFTPYNFG